VADVAPVWQGGGTCRRRDPGARPRPEGPV